MNLRYQALMQYDILDMQSLQIMITILSYSLHCDNWYSELYCFCPETLHAVI